MVPIAKVLRNAALACILASPTAHADDTGLLPITVGIPYPTTDTLPIYVAQDRHYFAEAHLAVDIVSLETGDKITFALLGGSIQIGTYTPDWFIRAIEKGAKIRIVLGEGSDLVFSMVAPDSINSYADLRGKRIGVSNVKAADAYVVERLFAAHGLGVEDYVAVPAGSTPMRAAALHAGALAATLLAPPTDQRLIDGGGFKRLERSSKVVTHYAWGGEAVTTDWAKAHKSALVDYIRAWIKAMRWLRDPKNREAGIALMARDLKLDARYARSAFDVYYGPGTTAPPDGKLDIAGYDVLLHGMAEQGQITPPLPPARKFLETKYWEEAQQLNASP